ncbi:hypothetical protein P9F86_05245 [Bacillus altitudinis]|uniref:hypothetical protein n=1 Tax=Bacillus altitudinis TaxID=293387 RepID=UPI002DBECCDF|nr:hypothetical protein [Bacillus altitudinis]MEC2038255.1 hypothetical protein [Bacillus altitudinis]
MPQKLKPYTDYVEGIRNQFNDVKDSLKGLPIEEALKKYEKRREEIRQVFIDTRIDDYVNFRETIQYPVIEAQHDPVTQGEPRHASRNEADMLSPDGMVFESIDFGAQNEKGDTEKRYDLLPGKAGVKVYVIARSRYRGEGESHIVIQPSITWKYDESIVEIKSAQDWEKIIIEIK